MKSKNGFATLYIVLISIVGFIQVLVCLLIPGLLILLGTGVYLEDQAMTEKSKQYYRTSERLNYFIDHEVEFEAIAEFLEGQDIIVAMDSNGLLDGYNDQYNIGTDTVLYTNQELSDVVLAELKQSNLAPMVRSLDMVHIKKTREGIDFQFTDDTLSLDYELHYLKCLNPCRVEHDYASEGLIKENWKTTIEED